MRNRHLTPISTDYYSRVEQGRRLASISLLSTLAEVQRLDDDQRAYLFELAREYQCEPDRDRTAEPKTRWQRLLDQLAESPALVLGPFADIVASAEPGSPAAAALRVLSADLPGHRLPH
ncbi:hypothetical protein ACIHAX_30905 [Nocardia sp. NPDC051929]|uniref:hypothetical protein n=1 Tax=Nocardia sp. NPDC051929 TaxID=3364327 RepID=UPI0037CACBD8